jgi:hypothetical protein
VDMTIQVQVRFNDGREVLFLVHVHPHSDFRVVNLDAMHIVRKKLGLELIEVNFMCARKLEDA